MFANRTSTFIGSLSLVSLLGGCSVPVIEDPDFGSNSGTDEGGSDEFGAANDEDGGGEGGGEGEATAKAHNTCLTGPEEGRYAFRHHCGGNLEFRITASADDQVIDKVYDYGFGPGFVDNDLEGLDTYASPMVAACCGGALRLRHARG